jgi:hypothetical protein
MVSTSCFVLFWKSTSTSPFSQELADYKIGTEQATLQVARDILSFGPRCYYFGGRRVCALCYDVIHNISHHIRDKANVFLRDNGGNLAPQPLFLPIAPLQRPVVLKMQCRSWIHSHLCGWSVTTSRDASQHIPFRPMVSNLFHHYTRERQVANQAQAECETFRLAFREEIVLWSLPRYRSEQKASVLWLSV